jgi:hypothetical protein
MPLYPLVAVLIGYIIDRLAMAPYGSPLHKTWRRFALMWALAIGAGGVVIGISGLVPGDAARHFYQPRWFCFAAGMIALTAAFTLWKGYRGTIRFRRTGNALTIVGTIALTAGVAISGLLINVNAARWYDPQAAVAEFKSFLPPGTRLVSLTPIEHRFAYYYTTPITELDWPQKPSDLSAGVDYFCFMRYDTDTAESRKTGRGRTWHNTPGTLPFAWEELKAASVDRRIDTPSAMIVVLGRVVRPLRAEISDATKPQNQTARRANINNNR